MTELREQVVVAPPVDGVSPGAPADSGAVFYCDCREPRTSAVGTAGQSSEVTKETMQTGD